MAKIYSPPTVAQVDSAPSGLDWRYTFRRLHKVFEEMLGVVRKKTAGR
jgi:hypothetical protein